MESGNSGLILKNGKKLSALILGGSGASGRELIDYIFSNSNYESVTVISRRKIDRWEGLSEEKLKKFIFVQLEDLEELLNFEKNPEGYKKIIPEKQYDTLFCNLGSRVNRPDFQKIDYDYVVASAKLAEILNIYHLSVVSSKKADSSSWFKYLKIKGMADDELMKIKNIPCISILRPGAIKDRDNDYRYAEKFLKYVPFISKVTCKDLGLAIMNLDLNVHMKELKQVKIFEHDELVSFANNKI